MKKNRLSLLLLLALLAQSSFAQAPKWVEKAKRAVFSVITYDRDDKMLATGNGFFIDETGTALSDYTLFKGAQRAVVITAEGTQMPVSLILGAGELYDVVKFKVAITEKKVPALVVARTPQAAGATVYLLPYSTQKDRTCTSGTIRQADKMEASYTYYTLGMTLKEKMVSCPVMNAEGEVLGLSQRASGKDTTTICYAVAADYAADRQITALSFNDASLRNIGIEKALPDAQDQALVYLYMASSAYRPQRYAALLERFIAKFPRSADGYLRRAAFAFDRSHTSSSLQQVAADLDQALAVADKKDEVYYQRAKLIYNYQLSRPDTLFADWTYDRALAEARQATAAADLPVYRQLEGDILFAQQDYAAAYACYEQLMHTNLASPALLFSMAKTKELMQAPHEEVLALMDSCIAKCNKPILPADAPYLLERAQMRMNAGQPRPALLDYDAYYQAVGGKVNDVFYYYREQAALAAKHFQRALDDLSEAIRLNPQETAYRSELAVVNIRVGRNGEAIHILQEALAIDPQFAEAYRLMGIAQLQLKQKQQACDSFAKAKQLGDAHVDELIEKNCR
ncbi:MAG: serine protease [Prevotellaceae bacterium]|jgi:predicted negative regulator of RcsB-dependent stress response|nr:serine protease [Prevotellaceae bacterium]